MLRPHEIARRGIAYVPQGRRVFHSLATHEHLTIIGGRSDSAWTVERIYDTFPRLDCACQKGSVPTRANSAASPPTVSLPKLSQKISLG
jgi:ABC-type branched-subunit amino acid transport system ATPase component